MTILSRDPLYFDQLPSSEGELYAPAAESKALIQRIDLFNSGTSTETVTLIKTDGVTPLPIGSYSLLPKAAKSIVFCGVGDILSEDWSIRGSTTTAATVTCTITGSTEGATVGGGPVGFQNMYASLFNGSNQYINIGDSLGFERTDTFSLVMWAKPKTVTSSFWGAWVSRWANSSPYGWMIQQQNGSDKKLRFGMANQGNGVNELLVEGSTIISDDIYRHFVVTYGGTSTPAGVNIYVNGIAETITTISNTLSATIVNSQNAYIGMGDGVRYFRGLFDAFGVYDVELSSGQALAIYNDGDVADLRELSGGSDLIHYWRMGDGEVGATMTDLVGSADGTLVNMTRENFVGLVP